MIKSCNKLCKLNVTQPRPLAKSSLVVCKKPSWDCRPRRAKSKLLVFLKSLCRKGALYFCLISFSPCPFKGRSKVVPLNTIKTYRRSEVVAPPIRNFGVRLKRVVNLIPWPPWKETLVPIHGGLDGSKNQSGRFGEDKNLFTLVRSELPIVQSVA